MFIDAWSIASYDDAVRTGDVVAAIPLPTGASAVREVRDLLDLSSEAAEAVLLAGALLQAYLDDARRLPSA